MKKLIIALVIFVIMISAAIGEIFYTNHVYGELKARCVSLNEQVRVCLISKDTKSALDKYDSLYAYWKSTRPLNLIVGNHTVVKSVDERLMSINEQIITANWEDACVYARALSEYFEDIKDDNYPTLTNFF